MLRTCTDGEIMAVSGEDPERFGEILWRHYPAVLGSTPSSAQIAEDLAMLSSNVRRTTRPDRWWESLAPRSAPRSPRRPLPSGAAHG